MSMQFEPITPIIGAYVRAKAEDVIEDGAPAKILTP